MHLSEGVLPLAWAVATTLAAVPFVVKGVREIKSKAGEEPAVKPMMGLMGAAVFVISALPIPVPIAGTSAHPTGVGMASIFIKPFPTAAITGVVLLLQALLMGHGGITTWGANTLNMGVVGTFAGYGAFRLALKLKLPLWAGAASAGIMGDLATYGATALTMALALHGDQSVWNVFAAVFGAFMPTQIPLAILEALLTAGMVNFMVGRRPDIVARLGVLPRPAKEAPVAV
ncbi:MAG: energy-coupling factor ABC transporter permease [Dehalococcoidia bacterium]|nr:energy-coupling factor ABC transporter permease [Dehalococcoidia bacterium]